MHQRVRISSILLLAALLGSTRASVCAAPPPAMPAADARAPVTHAPDAKPSERASRLPMLDPSQWIARGRDSFAFHPLLHASIRAHDVREARVVVPLGHARGLPRQEVELALARFEPTSADCRVEVGSRRREADAALAAAVRGIVHFEGTVAGVAGSSCYLAFGSTGAAGWVDLGPSGGHFILRAAEPGGRNEARGLVRGALEFVEASGTSAPDVPSCGGALAGDGSTDGGIAGFGRVPQGGRRVVELAIDTDYEYYAIFADATAASEYLGVLTGAISAIYRRDCDATIVLGFVRLQDDPNDLFNEPDPLVPFREYWRAQGGSVHRDLFAFVSGRRDLPYGGVAYVNAACQWYGYAVTGYVVGAFADPVATDPGNWDVNVVAHELGHNLGTYHTHDYGIDACASGAVQRGTIMSYCHVVSGASANIDLRFHRGTAERIEAFMVGAPCLSVDCDDDGLDDALEIAASPALDANADGILDACQDCNANGMPDPVEIALGVEQDADGDQRPDSCEPDCDADGVPDPVEIAANPALDPNGDFVLDACEPDCDGDGQADSAEIDADPTLDRSRDGRLDACEDCDGDGIVDFVELAGSRSRWVASAGDALLRELDPRSGVLRRTVACGGAPANDLAIGADGRLYAAVGNRVWALDRVADAAASAWSAPLAAEARAIAVAPSGELAVLLGDGRVELLDAAGAVARTLVPSGPPMGTPFDLVFRSLPDGTRDLLASFASGMIRRASWPDGAGSTFVDATAAAPEFRGLYARADGGVLVASAASQAILAYSATGVALGAWDRGNGLLLNAPHSLCDAGDGRTLLATSSTSGSTVNGYNLATGYTERTYRVYPADAPQATAVVVAPPSATDADGDLVPDECERAPGDLNGDGAVDAADLAMVLAAWGPCAGCAADVDLDGTVDADDLAVVLAGWR